MSPISISFYTEDHDSIFGCYAEAYPPFRKGDTVWLEETAHPSNPLAPDDLLSLSRYTVKDIQYTFCKHFPREGIRTFYGVEIVVERAKNE